MKIEPKIITQHCIGTNFLLSVLELLPTTVCITSIRFEAGFAIKRRSRPVSKSLTDKGVVNIRKADPSIEIEGFLTGTRKNMLKNISDICKETGLRLETVRIKRMTVQVEKNKGVFYRQQKKIPEGNKIIRKTVLGLVTWTGSESEIAKGCHTSVFKCKYSTQVVRTVLCEG